MDVYKARPISKVTDDDVWRMLFGRNWQQIKSTHYTSSEMSYLINTMTDGDLEVECSDELGIVRVKGKTVWFEIEIGVFEEYFELVVLKN